MEYKLISNAEQNTLLSAIEQILLHRGMFLADIQHYLNTTDLDILDPLLLDNMREGVALLLSTIQAEKNIFIQIDPDADGFTSAAILINYLYHLFPQYAQNKIIYRMQEGKQHGIIPETIPNNIGLVIAPDSSSNSYEECAALRERGIPVLVLDHHEAEKICEDACVINNQLCDYPTKSLSGAGIVYKFCSYIDSLLGIKYATDNLIDLAALGIISDMVSLKDFETRHIITKGLSNITNPFFSAMVETQSYSLGEEITPIGVAFYITPYINATIRSGTIEEKIALFEAMLEFKAHEVIPSTKRGCAGQVEERVTQVCRNCANIKNRQAKTRDNNLIIIENLIQEKGLLSNKILVVQLDEEHAIDKNLTGLIANQLMAKYQRPILLLNKVVSEEGKVTWEGSARGYEKSKLEDFKSFVNNSQLVEFAEGHKNAFGCGITDDKINDFISYVNTALSDFDFTPCYRVDFIYDIASLSNKDILNIAHFKHIWGSGLEEPLIAIEKLAITPQNCVLMSKDKNPTLKITLSNGITLIKFKSSEEEYNKLVPKTGCTLINIVGRCAENTWNGHTTPQILVEEYEIISQIQYYF